MKEIHLFCEEIPCWEKWNQISQSVQLFSPIVEAILKRENLSFHTIESMCKATNAIFKADRYVVKIYFPEAGKDSMQMEMQSLCLASSFGIRTPKLYAQGTIQDTYDFSYLVMGYIDGTRFSESIKGMGAKQKTEVARQLRLMTDRLHVPCLPFNSMDVIHDEDRQTRWEKYPKTFRAERKNHILSKNYGTYVFSHGDLNGNNILVCPDSLAVIDFADAVLAPQIYDESHIISELFAFDKTLIKAYFGEDNPKAFASICLEGLLIHDFGGDIIRQHIGAPEKFLHISDLYDAIYRKLVAKREENDNG